MIKKFSKGDIVWIKKPLQVRYAGSKFPKDHENHYATVLKEYKINDIFNFCKVNCQCGQVFNISAQFLVRSEQPTCCLVGCMAPAKFITIETLPQWLCADHAANLTRDVHLVTIKNWIENICPDGPHDPHVGCLAI